MATSTAPALGQRAKKIAQAARRKAAKVESDQAVNRSTRRNAALRIKAEALDQIAALK